MRKKHFYWSEPSSSSSSSCSSSEEASSFLGGGASLRGLPRPRPSPEPLWSKKKTIYRKSNDNVTSYKKYNYHLCFGCYCLLFGTFWSASSSFNYRCLFVIWGIFRFFSFRWSCSGSASLLRVSFSFLETYK